VRRAHRVHPISALQSEYSLLYREQAEAALPTLRELGISFVAYSPLGRSLLTAQIQKPEDIPEGDRRLAHPRFQGQNLVRNIELVGRVESLARWKGCTPAQLVLASARSGPGRVTFRTKRIDRLQRSELRALVQLSAWSTSRVVPATMVGAAANRPLSLKPS
jgi:aryl-alcohol dehydrogenase-like predicted oxidoreductase